jgi:hypothetical protein
MSHPLKTYNSNGTGMRRLAFALVVLACLPVSSPLVAQDKPGCGFSGRQTVVVRKKRITKGVINVLPQDEIWLVSARYSHLSPCDMSLIKVDRLSSGRWSSSSLECLVNAHATDKSRTTLIYAHGNRTDLNWAKTRALQLYSLALAPTACRRPPVRYVIFAWHSEREAKCAKDFLIKSHRSDLLGVTMAQVLAQFPDRQMVLVGFSLGAQVFVTALDQPCLSQPVESLDDRGKYRVAVIAPVLDGCASFRQSDRYPSGEAVLRAEVYQNSKDRAVRAARFIRRKQFPDCSTSIGELAARGNLPFGDVSVTELSNEMHKFHSVSVYARSCSVKTGLSQLLNEVYIDSNKQPGIESLELMIEPN